MNRFHYFQGNTEKFMWTDFTETKHRDRDTETALKYL